MNTHSSVNRKFQAPISDLYIFYRDFEIDDFEFPNKYNNNLSGKSSIYAYFLLFYEKNFVLVTFYTLFKHWSA